MTEAAVFVVAYLIGSVPFSYLVARRWGVADVRKVGSGNVGAANVMRSAGKTAGIVAFALDFAKGAGAALLAISLTPSETLQPAAAAAAVAGHMYPLWLRFKGGKGVATGAGAFLPLAPLATAFALGAFALTLALTRYVSVASVTGAVALALVALVVGSSPPLGAAAAGVALLIVWKHRSNFERIARGAEPRLGATRS